MRAKGMVLPRMNSSRPMGVTMICSMVPISRSRTMAMLDRMMEITMSEEGDDAGHEVVPAVQVGVEPGPRGHGDGSTARAARPGSFRRARTSRSCARRLATMRGGVAQHDGSRVGIRAVQEELHVRRAAARPSPRRTRGSGEHRLGRCPRSSRPSTSASEARRRDDVRSSPTREDARRARGWRACCPGRRRARRMPRTSVVTAYPKMMTWNSGTTKRTARIRGSLRTWMNSFRSMARRRSNMRSLRRGAS